MTPIHKVRMRKPASKMAAMERVYSLNSIVTFRVKEMFKDINDLLVIYANASTPAIKGRSRRIINHLYLLLHNQLFYESPTFMRYEKLRVSITKYSNQEVMLNFRFRSKKQLFKVVKGFNFPSTVQLTNRIKFSGEEGLLILLFRYRYPTRFYDMEKEFGRDYTVLCRIFNWTLNFLYEHWSHLLFNHYHYWMQHLANFRLKVYAKHKQLNDETAVFDDCHVFGFMDTTINAICRTAGGPVSPGGVGSDRHDNTIQRAFYTGYKKLHGLKYLTIGLPNGMHFLAYGPISARHTDHYVFGKTNISEILEAIHQTTHVPYCVNADKGFSRTPYVSIGGMGNLRISVEWNYSGVKNFFKLVAWKRVLMLRRSDVGRMFLIALLLHNAHISFNGSESANYFNCPPPSFESWIETDLNLEAEWEIYNGSSGSEEEDD